MESRRIDVWVGRTAAMAGVLYVWLVSRSPRARGVR